MSEYMWARAQRERLTLAKQALQLQKMQGKLVNAEEVRKEVFNLWHQDREAILNWPSRVAAIVAAAVSDPDHVVDPTRVHRVLAEQVRELLRSRVEEPTLGLAQ